MAADRFAFCDLSLNFDQPGPPELGAVGSFVNDPSGAAGKSRIEAKEWLGSNHDHLSIYTRFFKLSRVLLSFLLTF